jgi:hypothetical protein
MLQALRVTITSDGRVEANEPLDFHGRRNAILTFLDEVPLSPEEEDALIAEAQVRAATHVLEEEDFSHWPGHAEAVALAEEKRRADS